ncbi:interleukin-1 receptor-associated kinase-like 2 [Hyla sarda]|uniref:interleukin-1 receptor-associated kinase-like 2 n=1 Tax=Hyla sarda TaxID=327740 RepID=UPI0024C22E95|nr:interleukin-1 receptor-associated kinase-like 2 [Hyla sarda]
MACSLSGSSVSPLIIDLSPRVVDDFCRCVDSLNDWEWMRFASHVMNDQTTIQRFYMRRKSGDYVTRELLWSWGQKLATVQDLEIILQELELYRALEILMQSPYSPGTSPVHDASRGALQTPEGTEKNSRNYNDVTKKLPEIKAQSLPSPPQPPSELLKSLWIDSYADPVSSTDQVLSIPQQEISLSLNTTCQHWTKQQLEEATDRFSVDRKIHSGHFSDVFIGRKGDNVYAIKRLKEVHMEQSDRTDLFYEKEAQIGFRCHHPNLLKLLGFCVETKHYYLVHQFMKNGSLDVALQKVGSCVLSWERRLAISAGLLQGVDHLHKAGVFHGNIKSSNIFLAEDFTAKLGHAGARFCPDRSANYTNVKTYELQRFQPYLPDSYLRSGQLTAQTDIFSCGVVLAELLTGQKPTDEDRDPIYLKDLILTEVEQVKAESDRMGSVDLLSARGIGQKYTDKRLEGLEISSAIHWASAICLCLTKKRALLTEVVSMMEKAQESFRSSVKKSQREMSSLNIPEESDESLSLGYTRGDALEVPSTSTKGATYSPPRNDVFKRSPCEFDESGSFSFYPGDGWYGTKPSFQATASPAGHQANSCTPERNCPQKVLNSPTESNEPSWGIKVNEAKLKLMEEIELYAEEKVDSSVLFESA